MLKIRLQFLMRTPPVPEPSIPTSATQPARDAEGKYLPREDLCPALDYRFYAIHNSTVRRN